MVVEELGFIFLYTVVFPQLSGGTTPVQPGSGQVEHSRTFLLFFFFFILGW